MLTKADEGGRGGKPNADCGALAMSEPGAGPTVKDTNTNTSKI